METGFFSMTIVQVAISIVISWALFALLCSMIQELVVQVKSERGRFFRTKIFEKLYDGSNQINWGMQMYNHSTIKLLTKSSQAPPSTINTKMLAETLLDSVAFAHATQILKNNDTNSTATFKSDLLNDLEFAVNNLRQSDVILMLKNYWNKAKVSATLAEGYDEEKLYTTLLNDLQLWFDEFGNRTSAWYKKTSQKRLFLLGLLIATATNIDSLALLDFFKENPTARKQMETFYLNHQKELESLSATYNDQKADMSEIDAVQQKASSSTQTAKDSTTATLLASKELLAQESDKTKDDIAQLKKQVDSLKTKLDLPLGWEKANCAASTKAATECHCSKSALPSFSCILFKILGILISALAASLGAPFWFDVLKKATSASLLKK